ncbi:MAG TPA: amino acid adenylation domain-containing protein [Candidatus Dormibacteraeota bacterium]|nr:amino acid adenylation domain-containing protein [Candidatus Dormibacteraeota bacterium]
MKSSFPDPAQKPSPASTSTLEGPCVHEMFEAQVAAAGDAVAVVCDGERLTYRELNARANRMARRLRDLGAVTDALVPIVMDRSISMVIAILGSLKAGAAWLPLDPHDPKERIAFMLEQARAAIILTEERHLDRLPAFRGEILALDRRAEGPETGDAANPGHRADPSAIAYAIYTSGSTGTPKGVLVPHLALTNHMHWMQAVFALSPADGVVQKTPFTFDASIWEFLAPLVAGARLVLARPGAHQDPGSLAGLIADQSVTVLQMVPTGLRALLDEPGLERCRSLRRVFCGGEALPADLVERFFERLDAELVNLYGPTEACIDSTSWVCRRGERAIPIGRPIHGSRAYVLDGRLRPLPAGAEGELHIAGAGLARGYLERPDLTAERFLPDPISGAPGARMYATGDRACLRPDGSLEFLGRIDDQVKVRGYRIEPGEIEAVLDRHPSIAECVVVARPDAPGGSILVAYATLRKGVGPALPAPPSDLRAHVKTSLPDHMVPSAFVILDELPRTSSGKIDRRRLPGPAPARPELAVPFVAPRTEVERRVATLWAGLLGLDRVGVLDGFFDLGGHSLVATQVISRVRDQFGVELPLRDLFETPTVEGLASRIETARRERRQVEAPTRGPARAEHERPISFAQQRLWFLDQLDPGRPFYNVPSTLRLRGPLDRAVFGKALDEIVHRHEVLRTTFPGVDGKPVAVPAPRWQTALSIEDLSELPSAERWPAALRRARQEAQRRFDLERGPLFRAHLLGLDAQDHVLLLTFHHIVTDGWSEGVLHRELAALYAAFLQGRPSPLPALPIQYADYAAWQRDFLQGQVLDTQRAFWRQALAGAPLTLDLPTDRPRPAVRTHRGAKVRAGLSARLSEALGDFGREEGATPFMTILAAFNLLLMSWTGQDDILVGTPIANRHRLEIEGLIGCFVNTLVVRTDLSGDPTFRELLRRVRRVALEAYAHQDLPFERLVEELRPPRDLGRTALFQVMVAHAATTRLDLEGLEAEFVDIDDGISKFDLTLDVDDGGRQLACDLEYSTDLFDDATARRMLQGLETLLEGIAAEPGRRLSRLPLLREDERRRILLGSHGRRTENREARTVHGLIEERAATARDATAVSFGDRRITYAELDERAAALARRLVPLGVGPDVPVGLCVERSIEMLEGLLGILKAGGAYVPLDPAYPGERVAGILRETGTRVLLAQRRLVAGLEACGAQIVLLDDIEVTGPAAGRESIPDPEPQSLAYITHTSGSSGVPKGVAVTHGALLNHAVDVTRLYGLSQADRVLQFASLSFDVAAEEIFPTLLSGATLVLRPDPVFVSVPDFHRFLESEKVTVVNLPASYWHAWVAVLQREGQDLPACLRCVVIGSEKALASRLAAWDEVTGGRVALFNAYGPTEATITTTVYLHSGQRPARTEGLVPIGRPIANARAYVLDPHLNLAPVGVPGELYIGGEGVARGYVGRPDLTAERFLPDPFADAAGSRLYRTGDRVRWLVDGDLEFLGRLDDQVKVRGHRIEPGEIERALERYARVEESAVLAREDSPGDIRLVAYVVFCADAEPAPSVTDLRAHLGAILPEHMLPSAFVILERLPRTRAGKIDRKALPPPDAARNDLAGERIAPRTPSEETLASIWGQVFGRERVGVHDNFFELGGDSILAIQIVARVNQAGLRLTSRQIFEHQTIAGLASVAGTRVLVAADQGAVTGDTPLTPIQLWFFEQDFPDPHHFNQAVLLKPRETLDPARLEAAMGRLLDHHDALRMRYRRVDGEWRQECAPPGGAIPFEHLDFTALPKETRLAAMGTAAGDLQRGLDLERGPLLRSALFTLGAELGERLLIVIHHLVVDGVSWRILLDDLSTVYRQLERGDSVALPAKTTSYRRWAEGLVEYARKAPIEKEMDYWVPAGGREVGRLAVDHPAADDTEGLARVVTSVFSEDETRALLHGLPAAWRTEINDVLLTALVRTVSEATGRRAVLLDLEGHGREEILDDVDLSRTVGWFTTIKPVCLVVEGGRGPEEILKSIKEQLRALPARGIGYGLLRYLRDDGDAGARLRALPRAEISFNYLGQFDATVPESSPFQFAPESTGPVVSRRGHRTHLLEIGGYVASGRLRVNWKYGGKVHSRAGIQALARRFEKELRALLALGGRPEASAYTPSDFPLARLDQEAVDSLVGARPDLEDVYPLTPMQEGMLYHTLSAPESGVYVEHLGWKFHGPLDEPAFVRAWGRAAERHPILRTSFLWAGVERPLQVVCRRVEPAWDRLDWRGLAGAEQERELEQFLASDMRRGYDLSRAPLQRLAIMRLADDLHQFVWSHHHVLLDGWSLPVLLKEVMTLYQACRGEDEARLPETRPFRDYVAWLQRQDPGAAEEYWRRALAGFRAPTPLVVDRPASRSARPDDYRLERIRLSRALAARLRTLARSQQLTLNTVLQGAWALLLSRYSGEEDVLFGGVVSGRPVELAGSETMVGLFLNTLPVRVRLPGRRRVAEWLRGLQEAQVEMRQYEYTSLVQVQQWSDVPRGTPLFESIFVFENYPLDRELLERAGDLEIRDLRAAEWTHYPLNVVVPPESEPSIQISYDARRFHASAIRRMLGHLEALLEGIAADPGRRLCDLPMLTTSERVWLEERDPPRRVTTEGCLHERFETQAERSPGTIAVVSGSVRLTYDDLNRRANRLARRLRDRGVGPETRVAICLPRSIELIVAMLAVLKAGGAYVPLDPGYPVDRLALMLDDAGAGALIVSEGTIDRFPGYSAAIVLCDEEVVASPDPSTGDDANLAPTALPENPAYVIYTSGSTGRPKGVVVTHRSAAALFESTRERLGFDRRDVWTQLHSCAFDYSVWEIWGALLHGGRLVLVPPLVGRSPEAFYDLLRREGVTVLNLTPAELRQFLQEDERHGKDALAVRLLNIGGEALNPDDVTPWMARHPDGPLLFNLYGITETTVIVTWHPLRGGDSGGPSKSAIGRPIPGWRVHLLDAFLRPVPIGVPGEIYVGGPGLARGYLGRPDLTAERFVPDPYGSPPGARLYRSGDLARLSEDGDLEYLGRIDDQLKIRGFRIEPGEIEAALLRHAAVREAAVLARQDGDGERRLVAYVAPRSGQEAAPAELRAFLKRSLPDYMVPSAIVTLEALPTTANGKVDRRALPAPGTARSEADPAPVPPDTPIERELARLWGGLLGVETPGVEDNFFEAGGQSLLATLLISRVRAHLGAEVSLKDFLDRPTIRGLGRLVETAYLSAASPSELDAMLGLMDGEDGARAEES